MSWDFIFELIGDWVLITIFWIDYNMKCNAEES